MPGTDAPAQHTLAPEPGRTAQWLPSELGVGAPDAAPVAASSNWVPEGAPQASPPLAVDAVDGSAADWRPAGLVTVAEPTEPAAPTIWAPDAEPAAPITPEPPVTSTGGWIAGIDTGPGRLAPVPAVEPAQLPDTYLDDDYGRQGWRRTAVKWGLPAVLVAASLVIVLAIAGMFASSSNSSGSPAVPVAIKPVTGAAAGTAQANARRAAQARAAAARRRAAAARAAAARRAAAKRAAARRKAAHPQTTPKAAPVATATPVRRRVATPPPKPVTRRPVVAPKPRPRPAPKPIASTKSSRPSTDVGRQAP